MYDNGGECRTTVSPNGPYVGTALANAIVAQAYPALGIHLTTPSW